MNDGDRATDIARRIAKDQLGLMKSAVSGQPMTDEQWLRYFHSHSRTSRPGFVKSSLEKLFALAGEPCPDNLKDGITYPGQPELIDALVIKGWERLSRSAAVADIDAVEAQHRWLAIAAASQATEASAELIRFGREGAAGRSEFGDIEVVEKLADALKMAIEVESTQASEDRNHLYGAVCKFLDGWAG